MRVCDQSAFQKTGQFGADSARSAAFPFQNPRSHRTLAVGAGDRRESSAPTSFPGKLVLCEFYPADKAPLIGLTLADKPTVDQIAMEHRLDCVNEQARRLLARHGC